MFAAGCDQHECRCLLLCVAETSVSGGWCVVWHQSRVQSVVRLLLLLPVRNDVSCVCVSFCLLAAAFNSGAEDAWCAVIGVIIKGVDSRVCRVLQWFCSVCVCGKGWHVVLHFNQPRALPVRIWTHPSAHAVCNSWRAGTLVRRGSWVTHRWCHACRGDMGSGGVREPARSLAASVSQAGPRASCVTTWVNPSVSPQARQHITRCSRG